MDQQMIRELLAQFQIEGELASFSILGSGHIHDTLLANLNSPEQQVVLQRFNDQVFQKPHQVMSNIVKVTEHLRRHSKSHTSEKSLEVIPTTNGDKILQTDGKFWRLYNYITNSYVIDEVSDPDLAREGARAFGLFCETLMEFPAKELYTTIEGFHDLAKRFEQLRLAAKQNYLGRVDQHRQLLEFAFNRRSKVDFLSRLALSTGLPIRVTHNDTKINNVLFDRVTSKAVCVVDLDTVMPGIVMYDFGDMARTFCNAVNEEDPWEHASFQLELFEAMCDGFLHPLHSYLTYDEMRSLTYGPWYMTFIMGIRFLADFFRGDTYYKIDHPRQNLERAQNQFQLVSDIENKQSLIDKIIAGWE